MLTMLEPDASNTTSIANTACLGLLLAVLAVWLSYQVLPAINRRKSKRNASGHFHYEPVAKLRTLQVPRNSLWWFLQPHLVEWESLQGSNFSSLLALVHVVLGTVPNCDVALPIWPTAWELYNVIFPHFVNFPHLFLGTSPLSVQDQALAMYASSRANGCSYCTSHICSFANRRNPTTNNNVTTDQLLRRASVFFQNKDSNSISNITPKQRAILQVGAAVGSVPATLSTTHVRELQQHCAPAEIQWMIAAMTMFGAFNQWMDGLGVPLEESVRTETEPYTQGMTTMAPNGAPTSTTIHNPTPTTLSVDTWKTTLYVLYQGLRPDGGALWVDKFHLQRGIPTDRRLREALLDQVTGGAFARILSNISIDRQHGALTTILVRNLDDNRSSGLGSIRKAKLGVVFCQAIQNPRLEADVKKLVQHLCNDKDTTRGNNSNNIDDDDKLLRDLESIAIALAHSPSALTEQQVEFLLQQQNAISPAMMVELVTFFAMLQMLHRLEVFHHMANKLEGL